MIPVRTAAAPGIATSEHEQIGELPFGIEYHELRHGTFPALVTFWKPDPAEIEALMGGGVVKLSLTGVSHINPQKVEVVSFEHPAAEPG